MQQHRIAIDDAPVGIGEDRAIAVAVEGDAHPALPLPHGLRQALGMRRAAAEVDVPAIRRPAQHEQLEAQLLEQPRRDGRRCAVGRVDRQFRSSQALRIRKREARVRHVLVDDVRVIEARLG